MSVIGSVVLYDTLILVLQGNTTRRIGELTGHTASVTHIALDEKLNHVFTLGADKIVKVRYGSARLDGAVVCV